MKTFKEFLNESSDSKITKISDGVATSHVEFNKVDNLKDGSLEVVFDKIGSTGSYFFGVKNGKVVYLKYYRDQNSDAININQRHIKQYEDEVLRLSGM